MKESSLVLWSLGWKAQLSRPREGSYAECECIVAIPPSERTEKEGLLEIVEIPVGGLAERFARLETREDIDAFAREFGPLGLAWKQPWEQPGKADYPTKFSRFPCPRREKLSHWLYHIATVRRLLRIYYILKRAKRNRDYDAEEALGKVIRLERHYRVSHHGKLQNNGEYSWSEERVATGFYRVVWAEDGTDAGVMVGEDEEELVSSLEIAAFVLASVISRNIEGGIRLIYDDIVPAKDAEIGFRITERKYTQYLLAAIYYDLWEMVTEGRPVITCEFCGKVIEKTGRRKYCDDACKQAAYRERKRQAQ